MITISEKVVNYMSAIVAVCGTNFCSFVADTRKTVNSGNGWAVENDHTDKIFKLNDHILFGATGIYQKKETILSALKCIDSAKATINDVITACLQHLEFIRFDPLVVRNYLVGGKMPDGKFSIYEISLNPATRNVELSARTPIPPASNFAISYCFPPKIANRKNDYVSFIERAIMTSRSHKEMLSKIAEIIGSISSVDNTVGQNISALSIF